MERLKVTLLGLLALAATGETCGEGTPGNRAPSPPTFTLTTTSSSGINGEVSPCVDDGKPAGSFCTQEAVALLPGTTTVVVRAPVSGGVFELSGLSPLTQYDVVAGSYDTEFQVWGNQMSVTTVGTTGPFAFGVAPTEIVVPADVWIEGINMANPPSIAKLVDTTTGQVRPVVIEQIKDNRVRVHLERPSDLTGRRRYFLQLGAGKKAQLTSDVVYLSANANALPGRQAIRVHYVRWRWSRSCPFADGARTQLGPPNICGCRIVDRWFGPTLVGPVDPWPDEWTDSGWSRFKTHADDTSREWSAMCSPARGATNWVNGTAEEERRLTLPGSHFYWLEIATGSPGVEALSRRLEPFALEGGVAEEFCQNVYLGSDLSWAVPDDCTLWLPNQNGRITVHLVGVFLFGDEEVDPATARGYANPAEVAPGMLMLADNPFSGARPRIRDRHPSPVCVGDVPAYEDTSSPLHQTYWWGPVAGRDFEPTPNLLAHELHHVTTGFAHGGNDPCFTPAVGDPTGNCPRGLNMDLGANSTVASECNRVSNGFAGRDYTR